MTPAIFAPVKVNLALHVGPPRADGYHPVDTLCVFPAIGDVLSYDREAEPGIDITGPYGASLGGEGLSGNLVWRAFELLDLFPEGRFLLAKMTPVASGIGAGTADGAAAMLLLNDVLGLGFTAEELIARSIGLGADGPVCMAGQIHGGGLWRARGIGETLDGLGRVEPMAIVLANPGVPVPTGGVFRSFDAGAPTALSPVAAARRPLTEMLAANRNDLQPAAEAMAGEIRPLLDTLAAQPGARAARMSGSGATCYALHAGPASAERAARALRARGFWAESSFILPG